MQYPSQAARGASVIVAVVALVALGLQLWILVSNHRARAESGWSALWLFAGYFTIWTNFVVAMVATSSAFRASGFLASHAAQTASAVYIAIVMLIYEALLRRLWAPEGAQWWADLLLHNAVPVLWVAWWLLFSRKGQLEYRDTLKWLIYPLAYFLYALVRGAFTGFYAYPFIDVSQNGYGGVMVSAVGICFVFAMVGLLFIAMDRKLARMITP